MVPHLHSIQLRAQVLEWTLSNPVTYSISYNVHLLASYLGTMLLDDQLMTTGSHFNISLELKKAIWPQLAFLNVFFPVTPQGISQANLCPLEYALRFPSLCPVSPINCDCIKNNSLHLFSTYLPGICQSLYLSTHLILAVILSGRCYYFFHFYR